MWWGADNNKLSMKRVMILLLVVVISLHERTSAQEQIVTAFNAIPLVNLPYLGTKMDWKQEPVRSFYFPVSLWKESLNLNLWTDMGLTVPIVKKDSDFFTDSSIYRRLNPSNGAFYLGVIFIGAGDDGKNILITATSSGSYIDALEVKIGGLYVVSPQYWYLYVKQFKISADMQVTVYRLKPTSTTPIMFGSNTEVLTEIHAQRIDEIYQIDTSGRFVKTGKIKYQPKYYPLSTFYDNEINFWDGDEVPECEEEE